LRDLHGHGESGSDCLPCGCRECQLDLEKGCRRHGRKRPGLGGWLFTGVLESIFFFLKWGIEGLTADGGNPPLGAEKGGSIRSKGLEEHGGACSCGGGRGEGGGCGLLS
jgi:hypothetical protein